MTSQSVLSFESGSIVIPGDRLGKTTDLQAGSGTYVRGGYVCASMFGKLDAVVSNKSKMENLTTTNQQQQQQQYLVRIIPERIRDPILSIGQIVVAKVTRVNLQGATMDILAVETVGNLPEHFAGMIRKENIRPGGIEELLLHECFLPNDLVVARIISFGDQKRYFLSTAEPALGVVRAVSKTSGLIMIPISGKEMICPETKNKELRKCALKQQKESNIT